MVRNSVRPPSTRAVTALAIRMIMTHTRLKFFIALNSRSRNAPQESVPVRGVVVDVCLPGRPRPGDDGHISLKGGIPGAGAGLDQRSVRSPGVTDHHLPLELDAGRPLTSHQSWVKHDNYLPIPYIRDTP